MTMKHETLDWVYGECPDCKGVGGHADGFGQAEECPTCKGTGKRYSLPFEKWRLTDDYLYQLVWESTGEGWSESEEMWLKEVRDVQFEKLRPVLEFMQMMADYDSLITTEFCRRYPTFAKGNTSFCLDDFIDEAVLLMEKGDKP